jgi:hypothetical protein
LRRTGLAAREVRPVISSPSKLMVPAAGLEQPDDGARQRRLARTGLAHQPEGLPLGDVERHPAHGIEPDGLVALDHGAQARLGAEPHLEVAHAQKGGQSTVHCRTLSDPPVTPAQLPREQGMA